MIFNKRLLQAGAFVFLTFCFLSAHSQSVLLPNGFAHNDYRHKHPLFDALENGYTNIEADIFLEDKKIIIAHINPFFKPHRTLETLYLKPLSERIALNNGHVYKGYNNPVLLMIDVKTRAENTYLALEPLLEKYRPILSSYEDGIICPRAITIVLSGHRPYKMIKSEKNRLVFIDEDLRKTERDTTAADVYELSSCKYSKLLKWKGKGNMPDDQRKRLCAYVDTAHKYGTKVRLWASPENKIVWKELLKCNVDLINTDKLIALKNFLITNPKSYISSAPVLSGTAEKKLRF